MGGHMDSRKNCNSQVFQPCVVKDEVIMKHIQQVLGQPGTTSLPRGPLRKRAKLSSGQVSAPPAISKPSEYAEAKVVTAVKSSSSQVASNDRSPRLCHGVSEPEI